MILSLRPSKSYFRSNKSTLVKLTRLTIETGLVTTVAALLELILGLVFRTTFYHIAVFYTISKLYANCLLASLNFRLVLRSQSDPNSTAIVWDDMASNEQSGRPGFQPIHMQILAQVDPDVDVNVGLSETGPRMYSSANDQTYVIDVWTCLTGQHGLQTRVVPIQSEICIWFAYDPWTRAVDLRLYRTVDVNSCWWHSDLELRNRSRREWNPHRELLRSLS